jgi:UDP-N-acetylmuramate--alanine ligase
MTDLTTYHFIGVGGIGMSGLAELLVRQGHAVSGSDLAQSPITRRLTDLGVRFHEGHRPEHLGAAEVVVHSAAVKEDNPELAAARARGLKVLRRGELLARLMRGHFRIAVTGAHGKTSTTAMTAAVLRTGGLDPTVVVGANWDSLGSNAVLGRGGYFVAEADESDASFTHIAPEITVITNLDREHLDFYRDLDHIKQVFSDYLHGLPSGSRVVAWAGDPHLAPLLENQPHAVTTYSFRPGTADFWATEITSRGCGSSFRLWHRGQELGGLTLPLAGSHYVLNAMAAVSVAHLLGVQFPAWRRGLAGLGQIHRRCQVKGEARGILVLDDYGHHPTEIATTLAGLAAGAGRARPDSPPLPGEGRSPGHPGAGRLRPPPHGNRHHPRRPGPGLPGTPPGGGLSTPPLQPHPGPFGRLFPGLRPGLAVVRHRNLRGRGSPPERFERPGRL